MKVNVGAPFHIVNKESLEFLFDHDLIPRKKYDNLFELQLELDELLSFLVSEEVSPLELTPK